MRHFRAVSMVLVSLTAGLLAIVFAARWLNYQSAMATARVAVAALDLKAGEPVVPEQVRWVDWPRGSVPEGAFLSADALRERVLRMPLARDEPILEAKLAPAGTKGGLSAVIAPGMRAITVRVNDVIGVAGFALPGNYVDVIVSTRDESKPREDQSVSKIVLEKILVLAVGEESGRDDTKPRQVKAVTLEVSPAQAEVLDLARNVGQLALALRNQVDLGSVATRGVTKDALLGSVKQVIEPVVEKVAARVRKPEGLAQVAGECVEILSGRAVAQQCF